MKYLVVTKLSCGVDVIARVRHIDDVQGSPGTIFISFYRPDISKQVALPQISAAEILAVSGQRLNANHISLLATKFSILLQNTGFIINNLANEDQSPLGEKEAQVSEECPPVDESLETLWASITPSLSILRANSTPITPNTPSASSDHISDTAKRVINLCRKMQRKCRLREASNPSILPSTRYSSSSHNINQDTLNCIIAECYSTIGCRLAAKGMLSKAVSCLVLSIKIGQKRMAGGNSEGGFDLDAAEGMLRVVLARRQLSAPSATSSSSCAHTEYGNETDTTSDMLECSLIAHQILSLDDTLALSSNQLSCESNCGKSCRSADDVYLSPLDLYRISRAPSMSVMGVFTTTALYRHPRFKNSVHFSIGQSAKQYGYPIASLRPILARDTRGYCHFAYPLYRSTGCHTGGAVWRGGLADSTVLNYEEYLSLENDDGCNDRLSGHSTDVAYGDAEWWVTEEEEAHYSSIARVTEENTIDSAGDCSDEEFFEMAHIVESGKASHQRAPSHLSAESIRNSDGQPALGCLLAQENMPTLCASYPLIPELSLIDPFYVRQARGPGALGADSAVGPGSMSVVNGNVQQGMAAGATKCALATGWEVEEMWVAQDELIATGTNTATELGNSNSPTISVRDFLSTRGDMFERLQESDWFNALVQELASFLPCTLAAWRILCARDRSVSSLDSATLDESESLNLDALARVMLLYRQTLQNIWFDFDSLLITKHRPIKSYSRLKRDITSLSWTLAKATRVFLVNNGGIAYRPAGLCSDHIAALDDDYCQILKRLNITNGSII